MEDKIKKVIRKLVVISFLLICFSFGANAKAATLFFSPSSASCGVGGNASLNVSVGSTDQAMNAASGVISFPPDKLEVSSISKSGSIFSLWVQEPSFSNAKGTINFEGVIFNPGYSGAAGKIISINFKAKAIGNAPLSISSGSVLANDGAGTNILSGVGKASINITAATTKPKEDTVPKEISNTPLAPNISSATHPDSEKWYNDNNPSFEWAIPKDVTAISILADKNPYTNPGTKSYGLINSYDFKDVDDGVWYFHLNFKNSAGWGESSHFKFHVDTQAPENLNITEIKKEDDVSSSAKFSFEAYDKTSGIDYYEVQIDNGKKEIWRPGESEFYITPILGSGDHDLLVSAVDKAGNFIKNSAKFSIKASLSPEIIGYFCAQLDNKKLTVDGNTDFFTSDCDLYNGDILIVKGKINDSSQKVVVYLQRNNEDIKGVTIKTDCEGNFIFISGSKLKGGIYKVWAEAVSEDGVKSAASEKVSIIVKGRMLSIVLLAMDIFGMLALFIIFIAFLIIILWYIWHKFRIFIKKAKEEDYKVDHELYKSFTLFKKDIDEQAKKNKKVVKRKKFIKEE